MVAMIASAVEGDATRVASTITKIAARNTKRAPPKLGPRLWSAVRDTDGRGGNSVIDITRHTSLFNDHSTGLSAEFGGCGRDSGGVRRAATRTLRDGVR
jgi:hypothetical protein